ncbi:MarR family winged helix-turn-helix transcriptional regulator [Leifsonia sp. NPDC058292]|uniref:MarR family winged helix-turn-helix transcriptional regulator n=1 Tax=Leifsonia sp. NPDC058292 TaxID=3346428 RepID=UPI0036D7D689
MVTGDGGSASRARSLAADDDLAGRLALAVGRLNRRMRSSTGGLSHGQLSALSTIVRGGPIRPSEISAIEIVAAPTITRVIADLEARGLVTREPDPDDGRSFFAVATDAGVELLMRARSDRARSVAAILGELDEAQVESIRAAVAALESAAHVAATPGDRPDRSH